MIKNEVSDHESSFRAYMLGKYVDVQWNPSKVNAIGAIFSVRNMEIFVFQGLPVHLYLHVGLTSPSTHYQAYQRCTGSP